MRSDIATRSKIYFRGFTLIELLVTISIIMLMTLIGIPSFSKYGKEMAFKQKNSEIETLINQANVSAMNPEKGVVNYSIELDFSDDTLSVSDSNGKIIKVVKALRNQSINQIDDIKELRCFVPKGDCVYVKNDNSVVVITSTLVNFFSLTDTNIGETETFKISSNPFKVIKNEP